MKEDEMGRAYSTHGSFFFGGRGENLKGRNHLEDQGIMGG
jgi:hypothetical protein